MSTPEYTALPGFEEVSFGVEIESECFVNMLDDERLKWPIGVGLIVFRGKYRDGSQGRPDALFIDQQLDMFTYLIPISGLIVDFRELNYFWGDNLQVEPRRIRQRGYPVRVIVPSEESDPRRYKAFQWVDQTYRQLGVLGKTHELRTDIEAAYQEVVEEILSEFSS